jgi:hypothetical protein
MDANTNKTDLGELASETGGLMTGLGVISMTWFPFALPALVMAAVLVLPLVVLAPPVLLIWLLVRGIRRLLRRGASEHPLEERPQPARRIALTP